MDGRTDKDILKRTIWDWIISSSIIWAYFLDAVQTKRAADVSVQNTFKVEGKVYFFINQLKTFDEARSVCKKLGGDLASSLSYKEFDAVTAKLKLLGSGALVYAGAKMQGSDLMNDWMWVTGEPLPIKFQKWRRNNDGTIWEPNGRGANRAVFAFADNLNNEPYLATVESTRHLPILCQI